jgi:hypothetical protein
MALLKEVIRFNFHSKEIPLLQHDILKQLVFYFFIFVSYFLDYFFLYRFFSQLTLSYLLEAELTNCRTREIHS